MELAIVAGMVLFGYNCNAHGKARRGDRGSISSAPLAPLRPEYAETLLESDTFVEEAAQRGEALMDASYRDAMCPEKTGVVVGGRALPYFTSASKQATNPQMHQRSMELFTGTLDSCISQTGYYQPKEEVAPFFDPSTNRQRVSSGGSVGNPNITTGSDVSGALQDRFPTTSYLNEVTPVQSLMVGPGLNIPMDKVAAGGFQQFYRPPVTNVNEYRLTALPGRAIPGKASIDNTAAMPNVSKNVVGGETFMDSVRPALPSRAAYTEEATRGTYYDPGQHTSYQPESYSGVATGVTGAPSSDLGAGQRVQRHDICSVWGVNPTSSQRGRGGYTESSIHNWQTRRGDTPCALPPSAPPSRPGDGSYSTNTYDAPATMRSIDVGNANQSYLGPGKRGIEQHGNYNSGSYVPRTTIKEQMVGGSNTFMGPNGILAPSDRTEVDPSSHGMKKAQALAYTPGGQADGPPSRQNLGIRSKSMVNSSRTPASSSLMTDYAGLGTQTHKCGSGLCVSPRDHRLGISVAGNLSNRAKNPYALPPWDSA